MLVSSEVSVLEELPYKNLLKLVGRGKGLVSNRNLKFLVTDWVPGGDLESARKGKFLHNPFDETFFSNLHNFISSTQIWIGTRL